MEAKLPISAILVSHNEAHLLKSSLPPLLFCEEIIVVDLESKDNTKEIGEKYGATVLSQKRVPIVEIVHNQIQSKTKYDWILICDPDEVLSEKLVKKIKSIFPNIPQDIGSVLSPWVFYFKDKRLKGTPWGGVNKRITLINRKRFYFTQDVHIGRKLKAGYKEMAIKYEDGLFIKHFWMSSYSQLLEKHRRYLKKEGKAKFNNGNRITLKAILKAPIVRFHYAYFTKEGYKDRWVGLFLSLFWTWYQVRASIELWKYQKSQKQN